MADKGPSPFLPWALAAGGLALALFGGGVAVVAYKKSRGVRNNNPLNLRPIPKGWLGQAGLDQAKGGPFPVFTSPFYGWRAGGLDVFGDILKGQNTLDRIIKGTPERGFADAYAPASDNNDPEDYVQQLEKMLSIGRHLPLSVYLHGPSLLHSLARVENGIDPDTLWTAGPREQGTQAAIDYLKKKGKLA